MFIALQMKHKVFMPDEKVIIQGEGDKVLYIIMIGGVKIYIKEE
jgi:hypothetical protein